MAEVETTASNCQNIGEEVGSTSGASIKEKW